MTALATTKPQAAPGLPLIATGARQPTLQEFAHAEAVIVSMWEAGDATTLHAVTNEARILQLFHRRANNKAAATGFARLKILAEAGLGQIDLARFPYQQKGAARTPLVIDGREIPKSTRRDWRMLGIAARRGVLHPTLANLAADPDREVSIYAIKQALHPQVLWTSTQRLRRAAEASGLSGAEIARRSGVSDGSVHFTLKKGQVTSWELGAAIASAVGLDPMRLPLTRPPHSRAAMRMNARRRAARRALIEKERAQAARAKGGNVAEAFSLLRRCAQIADPAEQEFSGREQRSHMRAAYEYLRKAEDEIAAALGVS